MTAGFFRHIFLAATVLIGSTAISYAETARDCPDEPSKALVHARKTMETDEPAGDRAALACLIEAVAALNARLAGLSDGSIPFDGQIHIPNGYVITKAPTQEAD